MSNLALSNPAHPFHPFVGQATYWSNDFEDETCREANRAEIEACEASFLYCFAWFGDDCQMTLIQASWTEAVLAGVMAGMAAFFAAVSAGLSGYGIYCSLYDCSGLLGPIFGTVAPEMTAEEKQLVLDFANHAYNKSCNTSPLQGADALPPKSDTKTDTSKTTTNDSTATKTDSTKTDAAKTDSTKTDAAKTDSTKTDSSSTTKTADTSSKTDSSSTTKSDTTSKSTTNKTTDSSKSTATTTDSTSKDTKTQTTKPNSVIF